MARCGLLGRRLGHSYSPAIHALLGPYSYELFEKEPEELADFLQNGEFHGLNVTIPYKKAVVPYCDDLSPTARLLQSVNTLVRREDGTLFGDNTDYDGFAHLVRTSGVDAAGKKALVLGSGGASVTVCAVLRQLGAQVVVISRSGGDNYENLRRHADAALVVNTTPVGMYPRSGEAPLALGQFPRLEAVFDLIYNPARTALLLQAEELNIPGFGGLAMLVAQARKSSELFQDRALPAGTVTAITRRLDREMENIILIGMPGSGKSSVAAALGRLLGREVWDSDAFLEETAGMTIPAIFAAEGEAGLRRRETEALRQLGQRSGIILATGGGCVTREENYPLLHQNGRIFFLDRPLDRLPTAGRPLSQRDGAEALFRQRQPLYQRFADRIIPNRGTVDDAARTVKEAYDEIFGD